MTQITLSFLRHAKVPSHKGDMPLTKDSRADIDAAVPRLRALGGAGVRYLFLATQTNRSRQTAEALRDAIDPDAPKVRAAWGLRNPDLYLAGSRVEMGSTAAFIASQSEALEVGEAVVLDHPFFGGFLSAPDRIEYWLRHTSPPGETAADVARRVLHFARSFDGRTEDRLVVACVTHSPVLRAIITEGLGLSDPGEPGWVEAVNLHLRAGAISFDFRGETADL
ncbi:MAG: histidine phosphatase family protein [Pseudomonadota bacterium]